MSVLPSDHVLNAIGTMVVFVFAAWLALAVCGAIFWTWCVWRPHFHVGKLPTIGEIRFYDRKEILTAKGGGKLKPKGYGNCVQALKLKWWFGMSSPRKPKWFIGIIRWDLNK